MKLGFYHFYFVSLPFQTMKMKFISIDPSLSNLGIVRGEIINDKLILESHTLVSTEKSKNKTIRVSSDTIQRSRFLLTAIKTVIEDFKPQIIFAETPSGSQSASGMLSYGISCCIIASCNPPAIELTPVEVKKHTVGTKTASKKEIIEYVNNKYPGFLETKKDGSVVEGRMEHIADAVCIAEAGLKSDQYKQIKSYLNNN